MGRRTALWNKTYGTLKLRRSETSEKLELVNTWFGSERQGPEFVSREAFNDALLAGREERDGQITSLHFTGSDPSGLTALQLCSANLKHYTALIDGLLELSLLAFSQSKEGRFWLAVQGFHSWLMASDLLGSNDSPYPPASSCRTRASSPWQASGGRWAGPSSRAAASTRSATSTLWVRPGSLLRDAVLDLCPLSELGGAADKLMRVTSQTISGAGQVMERIAVDHALLRRQ